MNRDEQRQVIDAADRKGHDATALELLERYLAEFPDDVRRRYDYADTLRALGRLSDAEAVFKAIEMDDVPPPRRYLIALGLAETYRETGRWDLATAEYERAAGLRPDSTVPWVFWGAFLSGQGRLKEAMAIFERGLTAEGDLDEVHFNLGNCSRALRDYRLARSHYEAALLITPEYPEAADALHDIEELLQHVAAPSPQRSEP